MKRNLLLISLVALMTFVGCSNTTNNPSVNVPSNGNSVYVEEEPYVTSLELLEAPTRTSYLVGELFDPSGIVIKANWSHTDPYGNPMFEDDIKKNDLSHWTPNGPLKVTDKKVTVFYEGKSLDIDITVDESKKVSDVKASRQSVNHIVEGETLKIDSLLVEAQYSDGSKEEVSTYSVKLDGNQDVTETMKMGIQGLSVGKHKFTVTYMEKKADFFVQVLPKDYQTSAIRVEADNLKGTNEVTSEDKYYVEQSNSLIAEACAKSNASNGYSLSKIFLHTTVKLHYYSDKEADVAIVVNGASTSRNSSTKKMTDIYLEDVMSLKVNKEDTSYDRGAYFKGLGSSSEWFKWYLTYLGTFHVNKGDNVFEFYMFDEQAWPNSKGEDGGATLFNLDYFDFLEV